jgi:hypothetical protein
VTQTQTLSAPDVSCNRLAAPAGLLFFDCNSLLYREVAKAVTVAVFLMRDLVQLLMVGISDISAAPLKLLSFTPFSAGLQGAVVDWLVFLQ